MKRFYIYTLISVFILAAFTGCEKETEYDISWPVPEITDVSSYNAELSSTLTLKGNFVEVTNVLFGKVEGVNLQIAAGNQSLTVNVPRNIDIEGAYIKVTNKYNQEYTTTEKFIPIIPETSVSEVSEIQFGKTFTVTGVNVDLVTEVVVNGEKAIVVSKTTDEILVSVAGLNLSPGQLATVEFKSLAKNEIPAVQNVDVVYPFILYQEIVLWDFEDGNHDFIVNWAADQTTATVEDGTGMPDGGSKYFSLRAPGDGWGNQNGYMIYGEVVDVSGFTNPYISFAVRTPVGSKGYASLQFEGSWRHFGYSYDTGGEWLTISQPLADSWEGAGWDPAKFNPQLGFKAGGAGDMQDIDVAYVKITEGPFNASLSPGDPIGGSDKPAKITIMDFEVTNDWPDLVNDAGDKPAGSLTYRKTGDDAISAFNGNGFFTFTDDGTLTAKWKAYWGLPLKYETPTDLSAFEDPYISIALNRIEAEPKQRVFVKIYQYGEQLQLVFPVVATTKLPTGNKWETFQISLYNGEGFANWSPMDDPATPVQELYKSYKNVSKLAPIDKVEVIVGKAGGNTLGISIDEVVITEGPRY